MTNAPTLSGAVFLALLSVQQDSAAISVVSVRDHKAPVVVLSAEESTSLFFPDRENIRPD